MNAHAPREQLRSPWRFSPPRAVPHEVRQMAAAIQRDESDEVWRCRYCRVEVMRAGPDRVWDGKPHAERDHILPRSRGGAGVLANIAVACQGCNVRKGAHLLSELPADWAQWRTSRDRAVS